MGRARDAQIRLGWFLIFAFGIWLWPQLDTTPQADPQARNVEGLGPRTAGRLPTEVHDLAGRDRVVDSPKIKRDASTKWWGEWADGRERAIPTDRFDKPSGELASVVCMTALPERLLPADGHPKSLTELTVQDLWRQPDLLILTVPASDAHTIPAWVTQYEENVVVVRTRIDYGPSTRAVGCMFAIPEEYGDRVAIIEVDDDAAYPPNFVAGFLTYLKRHPTGAFSLSGFTANGDMAGEAGPPGLHSACPRPSSHGELRCTVEVGILEGFMGLAVLRKYLHPALERVADHSEIPLACFYGDDAFVSYSVTAAGAQPRVIFDRKFNAFTFNSQQKRRQDVPDKVSCITSRVPGLTGSCPNSEAYAQCKQWFDGRAEARTNG